MKTRRIAPAAAAVLGLLLASGCASGDATTSAPVAERASAPAACIDALDLVGELRAMAGEAVTAHIKANRQISVALKAGLTHDTATIDELTADTRVAAAQQRQYNRRLGGLLTDYEAAEAACRQTGSTK